MKPYDPFNWYWTVAGDATRAFSSASGGYVSANNAAFVAWKADGSIPTSIPNEEELGEVLAPYNIRPVHENVLDAYQDSQARKLTIEVDAKVLFHLANEVRELKGQQPITANQFKNYVKGLM